MKHKIHFFCWTVFSTVAISGSVQAQEIYTLEQCKAEALKESLQLKADALDLDKTNASIKQAYSALLPSITINGNYQYSPQVQTSVLPGETFGGQAGSYSAAQLGVAQNTSAAAELSQTLFNASSFIALKAAKLVVSGNELQIRSSREDLVYNVSATYYNIQSILKKEELTSLSLQNTEELLKSCSDQFAAGLATQTDVDRLTVTRDNTRADLEGLHNSREKYFNLLKVLMNMPLKKQIAIEPFKDEDLAASSLTEYNAQQKTNYQQVLYNKKISELEYKNINSGYLPTLSAYASYGLYGYNNEFSPIQYINDKFYAASSVGLRLKVPVFDGFSIKYKARAKKIDISRLDIQAEQVLQQNEKDVADAAADLSSNLITYQSQKRNLVLARKIMTDINVQYQSGLVKVTDVINTTSDQQTAQNNYVSALINIKQAELNLKKAKGNLLP